MTVDGGDDSYDRESREDYVMIFGSDTRQTLESCGVNKVGMCKLDGCVRSKEYSRKRFRGVQSYRMVMGLERSLSTSGSVSSFRGVRGRPLALLSTNRR